MSLTVGSLFSGIGGLDLGLERAGMRVVWQCEVDPYASRVLAKHWPNVPNLGDITKVDFAAVEPVDVLCGGFPCQDLSNAGKRAGINGKRSGLWSEIVRGVRVLRPCYVIVENVSALLSGGNGDWFGRVLGDLADCGYDAEWSVLTACTVGAPHPRERVFIVAHCPGLDEGQVFCERGRAQKQPRDSARRTRGDWPDEPDVGRVADGVSSRVDRLRGLGNAVVPQVAELIGQQIVAHAEANTLERAA